MHMYHVHWTDPTVENGWFLVRIIGDREEMLQVEMRHIDGYIGTTYMLTSLHDAMFQLKWDRLWRKTETFKLIGAI